MTDDGCSCNHAEWVPVLVLVTVKHFFLLSITFVDSLLVSSSLIIIKKTMVKMSSVTFKDEQYNKYIKPGQWLKIPDESVSNANKRRAT